MKRTFPLLQAIYLGLFLFPMVIVVWDSRLESGFTSLRSHTEVVTLSLLPTQQQYGWTLYGAYICYNADRPPTDAESNFSSGQEKSALCAGPYGRNPRRHMALADQVSLVVSEETALEISVVAAPYMAPASDFPLGEVPKHILVIRTATPVPGGCGGAEENAAPLLATTSSKMKLWEEAEIHIPVSENTLMPFVGRLMVGQTISADTPNQLLSGVVSVYRNLSHFWLFGFLNSGNGGPQLIGETSLFPGDVVQFQHDEDCFVPASGFLRTHENGDGSYIEVVASLQSSSGFAVIERDALRPGGEAERIVIERSLGAAVISHPYTVWLGIIVTVLIAVKEMLELFGHRGRRCGREEVFENLGRSGPPPSDRISDGTVSSDQTELGSDSPP